MNSSDHDQSSAYAAELLSDQGSGRLAYALDPALGHGTMTFQRITPTCLVALVDFACTHCPNSPTNPLDTGQGTWFSVNYCLEGRCEVSAGRQGYAVVKTGDCCVSCADEWPKEFNYPLGIYRGVELWINTELAHDPSMGLLHDAAISLSDIARRAGIAAVFSNDGALNDPLRRMKDILTHTDEVGDRAIANCKLEIMRFLLALSERDVAAARPVSLLSPAQMHAVKQASEHMRAHLSETHDARVMAKEIGVSATTLNNWFSSLYGMTAAAYLRHIRMEEAASLLNQGMHVADVSIAVGYANPSKFAAAFKREHGIAPSEFRHITPSH